MVPNKFHAEAIQFILNISSQTSLSSLLSQEAMIRLVLATRSIYKATCTAISAYSSKNSKTSNMQNSLPNSHIYALRADSLLALMNLAVISKSIRNYILGDDLIAIFELAGTDNTQENVKYVTLISLISCEERCCHKLIDSGAHSLLTTVQNSMDEVIVYFYL